MSDLVITGLWSYPVKSMAGCPVATLRFDEYGPQDDRRWMVVNEQGEFLSQRTLPELGRFRAAVVGQQLTITAPDGTSIQAAPEDCEQGVTVRVWSDSVRARVAPGNINQWLSHHLQRPVILVRYQTQTPRPVDPAYAEGYVGFADGFPLLLCHESSLADLNRTSPVPLEMARFRPNVVVSGGNAWEENQWSSLFNEQHRIDLVKPCSRCSVITLNPETQEKTPKVLKHLMRHSSHGGQPVFGQNGVLRASTDPLLLGACFKALTQPAVSLA